MDGTTEVIPPELENITYYNETENTTGQSVDESQYNSWTHYLLLSIVQLGILLGNLVIILTICFKRKLWTTTNMFLLSLAIGDMMVGAIVIPINYAVPTALFYGYTTCIYSASFTVIISLATISNIFAVSFDRYIAITRPLRYKLIMTPTRVALILLVSWGYAIVLGLLPLMGWRVEISTCRRGETYDPYYVILIFVSGVVLPITGSGIMYARIIYIAWNLKKRRRELQAKYTLPAPSTVHVNQAFTASCADLGTANVKGDKPRNMKTDNVRNERQVERSSTSENELQYLEVQGATENENSKKHQEFDDVSQAMTEGIQDVAEVKSANVNANQSEIQQPRQLKKADRSNLITFAILTIYFEVSWLPVFVSMMIDAFVSPLVLPWWSHSLFGVIAFTNSAIDPIIYGYGKRDIRMAIVETCKKICKSM